MIRVLVVAASPVGRAGYSALVATSPNLTVVGSASDWEAIAPTLALYHPDVVLLESSVPDDEFLSEKLPFLEPTHPAIVVVAEEPYSLWQEAVKNSLVQGILPQTATELEIVASVEAVAKGLVVLHPDVIESMLALKDSPVREALPTNGQQALSKREIEVLEMLASGMGNKTIAKRLGISEHTVKFHVSSIFQKLQVSTRTEAVTIGVRLGLIML